MDNMIVDNVIVFWMCFVMGWMFICFSVIGCIYICLNRIWAMYTWTTKAFDWKDRAVKAEYRIRRAEKGQCLFCSGVMEDVKPTANATECQDCLVVRWNDSGVWDISGCAKEVNNE